MHRKKIYQHSNKTETIKNTEYKKKKTIHSYRVTYIGKGIINNRRI